MSGWLAVMLLAGCLRVLGQPSAATNDATSYAPVHLNPVLYLPLRQQQYDRKKFVDQYAAPPVLFSPPADPTPLIDPAMLQTQSRADLQKQKHQEDLQKNWMLLTPEEILGVEDKDKKGQDDPDENLTAEQRFIKRLEVSRINTNAAADHAALFDNNWRRDNNLDSQFKDASSFFRSSQSSFSKVHTFDNPAAEDATFNQLPQQAPRSPWASAWSPPPEAYSSYNNKPDPAQAAEMERFRAILSPANPAPPKPLNAGSQTAGFYSSPASASAASPSPLGLGYAPIKDNIGRPKPLPSLFASPNDKPAVDNSHHPAPPPWLVNRSVGTF